MSVDVLISDILISDFSSVTVLSVRTADKKPVRRPDCLISDILISDICLIVVGMLYVAPPLRGRPGGIGQAVTAPPDSPGLDTDTDALWPDPHATRIELAPPHAQLHGLLQASARVPEEVGSHG